ncbi:MAG: hypothetical protein NT003_03525 [Candidatus Magasanikbacteria bacterium]|nr:hypothetical protein [Candidatus Magasanikbacteria bacterium]
MTTQINRVTNMLAIALGITIIRDKDVDLAFRGGEDMPETQSSQLTAVYADDEGKIYLRGRSAAGDPLPKEAILAIKSSRIFDDGEGKHPFTVLTKVDPLVTFDGSAAKNLQALAQFMNGAFGGTYHDLKDPNFMAFGLENELALSGYVDTTSVVTKSGKTIAIVFDYGPEGLTGWALYGNKSANVVFTGVEPKDFESASRGFGLDDADPKVQPHFTINRDNGSFLLAEVLFDDETQPDTVVVNVKSEATTDLKLPTRMVALVDNNATVATFNNNGALVLQSNPDAIAALLTGLKAMAANPTEAAAS